MRKVEHHFRTVEQKMEILHYAQEHGLHSAERHYGASRKCIREWRKEHGKYSATKDKRRVRTLHPGKSPKYSFVEAKLYKWIIKKRSKGIPVITSSILNRAKQLSEELDHLKEAGLRSFVTRFLARNFLTLRKPTHVGQMLPENFLERMDKFRTQVLNLMDDHHIGTERIVNIDETAVYFDPPISRVIDVKGSKSIHIKQTKGGKRRMSLVLAVTFSGGKLPPLFIFQGGFNKFLQKKLRKHPSLASGRVFLICDKKAWCSLNAFHYWIHNIWSTFNRNMDSNLLILDDYTVHKNSSVKSALQIVRTKPCYIPGGLTYKLQPLDIGINNIVKNEIRKFYASFMIDHESASKDEMTNAVIDWIDRIWNGDSSPITYEKIQNSFEKALFGFGEDRDYKEDQEEDKDQFNSFIDDIGMEVHHERVLEVREEKSPIFEGALLLSPVFEKEYEIEPSIISEGESPSRPQKNIEEQYINYSDS